MSQKDVRKESIEKFTSAVLEASRVNGISTYKVSKVQFNEHSDLSEWDLRKLGGFSNLMRSQFPNNEKDLASIQSNKNVLSYVNKLEKDLGNKELFEREILKVVNKSIKPVKVTSYKNKSKSKKQDRHIVAMLNDLHYGLNVDPEEVSNVNSYNWEIASRRTAFFINEIINYKQDKRKEVECLHLLLNGDLIAGIIHGLTGNDLDLLGTQFNGAVHILTNAISRLAENYNSVRVYFSTGNHGDAPHRRESGRVLSQIYDSFEGMIFYALSAAHRNTKNVKFECSKSLFQEINLPNGRAAFTHGHLLFSKQLGNPGSSVNTKSLSDAIMRFNDGEKIKGKEKIKLILLGHTHCHFHITTPDNVQVYNAPSLSGVDAYAFHLGINHNLTAQVIFESTKDYIFGDSRLVHLQAADNNKELDKLIPIYKFELVNR